VSSDQHTLLRSLHDVGLAAWFGGTLANAVALNPAAGQARVPNDRGAVANAGWDRWTPVNAAAIGMHLAGAAGILVVDQPRVIGQRGVTTVSAVKTGLTAAAVGVTAYSRILGRKVSRETEVPVVSGTEPLEPGTGTGTSTPPDVAGAQKQLRVLQWIVPALTGAVVVISAVAGEQQRPTEVMKGLLQRVTPGA
jgi:hypothetical protein